MIIRIPAPIARAFNFTMDWLARHLLPPPVPLGIRIWGYEPDWTDVGTLAWGVAGAAAMVIWTGNWWWVPAMAMTMIFWAVLIPRA